MPILTLMAKKKKKHHYLPQFYISNFCNNTGEVFVWNKEDSKIHKQGKNGTFHIPYFYTVDFSKYKQRHPASTQRLRKAFGIEHVDTSGVKEYPDMIEDLLGESENEAANVIRNLLAKKAIYAEDKMELATFIALMYVRTPSFREWSNQLEKLMYEQHIKEVFSDKEEVSRMYEKMKEEGCEKEVDVDGILEFVKNKRYTIQIPKEQLIQVMLMAAPVIDQMLYKKTWFIVEAGESNFVTSDNPVFLLHPELGFENKENQVFFPLSKSLLLIMQDTPHGKKILYLKEGRDEVNRLNKLIASRHNNYVIAMEEELLAASASC